MKWRNNQIESNHTALKRIVNPAKGFKTLRTVQPTLLAIEAFGIIKRGDSLESYKNVAGELHLVSEMFGVAA